MLKVSLIVLMFFSGCMSTLAQTDSQSSARKLSIESLVLDMSDISGSVHQRRDANNSPCALIKIQLVDKIKKVEGQVVGGIIDKGSEKWVYVTEGTKRIKVIPSNYLPFELSTKDYPSIGSFKGKKVYLLKISGETLTMNVSKAVKKSTEKESIIPAWIINRSQSEWFGVSAPCHSPERARNHAICNALCNYLISNGLGSLTHSVDYKIEGNSDDSHTVYSKEIVQINEFVTLSGIALEITREYYNYRGEYFVLCTIVEDKSLNENNIIIKREISFNSASKSYEEDERWDVSFSVAFHVDSESATINFFCNNDSTALLIDSRSLIGNQMVDYAKTNLKKGETKEGVDIGRLANVFSFGIAQTSCYAFAPLVPTTCKFSVGDRNISNVYSDNIGDKLDFISNSIYHYQGEFLPFPIQFENIENHAVHISVIENMGENIVDNGSQSDQLKKAMKKEAQATGLSENYFYLFNHFYEKDSVSGMTISVQDGLSPLLIRKNVSFWTCWIQWSQMQSTYIQQQNRDGTSALSQEYAEDKSNIKISDKVWRVHPLWFLDSSQRNLNHKNANTLNGMVRVGFIEKK